MSYLSRVVTHKDDGNGPLICSPFPFDKLCINGVNKEIFQWQQRKYRLRTMTM
jgi:hypothetical protein